MLEYIYVATGSLILFIVALVLGKNEKDTSDYIFASWLLIFLMNIIAMVIVRRAGYPADTASRVLVEFSEASLFIHGPLFWFYARSFTLPGFSIARQDVLHLLPFFITFIGLLIFLFADKTVGGSAREILFVVKITSVLVYVISVLRRLSSHHQTVENIFSNLEDKYLKWLSMLTYGILIAAGIASIVFVAGQLSLISFSATGGALANVAVCIFIYIMGYFGVKQNAIFNFRSFAVGPDLKNDVSEHTTDKESLTLEILDPKYKKSGLSEEKAKILYERLKAFMTDHQPYLDKELTLLTLADLLKVHPNHLSQVINVYENQNFFDFINSFRVRKVQEHILSDNYNHLSLLGIAMESGFNSKASFNRAFKKFAGKTPSEFKKNY